MIIFVIIFFIHHIVHMEKIYFDYTLPILQNFEKTFFVKKLD